jgi:hypothetical protein
VEYCFAVPANRIGSAVYSPAELKTIQEVITLIVFAGFTAIYFDEPLSWTQAAGFALIALGAAWYSMASLKQGGRSDLRTADAARSIAPELHAPEDVSHRQDDIGDDGNPEGIGADQGNCDERADDGEHRQNQRNDENRGGRR